MQTSLEGALAVRNTDAVSSLELQIPGKTECQNKEQEQLLGIETLLEMEIETYRRLHDGECRNRGTETVTDNGQLISSQVNNVSDIKFKSTLICAPSPRSEK
ncbi:keratin, type I cytoskeletal 24 isoform X3 [Tamandua tetradactyla]|uniref:keratin, type I cytoskeletal 24 isoform X3 n=1 Tax=Tamandua tetradactyla TaxID=48850 RepID=UPI00405430A3